MYLSKRETKELFQIIPSWFSAVFVFLCLMWLKHKFSTYFNQEKKKKILHLFQNAVLCSFDAKNPDVYLVYPGVPRGFFPLHFPARGKSRYGIIFLNLIKDLQAL